MLPQVPQKRARLMSSTGGRPPVGLHIDLPPPDLSQFKAPGEGPAQPPGPAQAQGQAGPSAAPAPPPQQQGPLFTSEVKEMFYYIRGAALKAAEIVRYQTDMKQLQRVNGQVAPVPNRLLGAFRQDTERLDQVCDVMEAKILRLISVLVREINRQKAKAAEEAAAKAALEREQAAAAAAAAAASMASSNEAAKPETVKTEDMDLDTQPDGGQPSDTEKVPPSSEPNSSLAPPRVSSTAPSVVSLSNLPSSADLSEAAATDQATKARPVRNFNLKLDLSSPNLRGSFTGLVPNTAAPDPPGSPVRIAPKSAKPRTDDPTAAAFGLMGPPQFNPALMQQLAAQQPTFVQNTSMPFSGVADPSDTNALIPDILSSVSAAAQQASASATQPNASLQAFSAGDVIDLTGNSPIRGQVNMPINVDADGLTETIDLTMDSPTIPLSQFVASKKASGSEGESGNEEGMTGIETPAVQDGAAKVENTTPPQQANETSTGPAPDASLEGLVSSLAGAAGEAQSTNGDVTTATTAGLSSDTTSLIATLAAAAQTSSNDNTTNGTGASNEATANAFQGLIPSGDLVDLSSFGLGGDMGMDLSAMGAGMGMYPSGGGLGDAATAGMFEGYGGLMGDGGAGTVGAGMDFDMLGDIFAEMGATAGDGSNTQNN